MGRIRLTIPLEGQGRRFGRYHIPHSDNRQPYGHFGPIAVLANGEGPTLLLTGGVHGDEYSGPLAILRLARELELSQLSGRLILLPALNAPAMREAARCSPLDGGNLNRAFPGDPDGGPTAMIADWVQTEILPHCDGAVDFHAGGRVTEYAPLAMVNHDAGDAALSGANMALARAFGVPLIWRLGRFNDARSLNGAAWRAGVAMLACEIGGRADPEPRMTEVALDGARRVMRHMGMLEDGGDCAPRSVRLVQVADPACSHFAPHAGLFDPLVEVGTDVEAGDLAGWVRDPFEIERPPTEVRFALSGHLAIRGTRGLVGTQDLLFGLVTDL